jgi:membrane protease YdiL (CAAX protease family)
MVVTKRLLLVTIPFYRHAAAGGRMAKEVSRMAGDDRLTDKPSYPPSDSRLTDQPPAAPAAPAPPGEWALQPVTLRVVALMVLLYCWPLVLGPLLLAAGLAPRPAGTPTPEEAQALMRLQLIADALAFPLQIASVVLLLPRLGGVRLGQIGLTPRRLGCNVLWGVLGWLVITPVCFAVNYGVIALYGREAATNVQEHPFVQIAAHGLTPAAWLLLIFTATVSAPAMEELLFRGALQSWLERNVWASHGTMALALVVAAAMKGNDIRHALPQGGATLLIHLLPILFIVGLAVIYAAVCSLSRTAAPAVFAASALFASVHSFAWPSPVPLFVLALGLGWLAQRTRSLAGPMVLHGLFNAVSCVLLFFPQSGVTP